jgi:hypothetical protein
LFFVVELVSGQSTPENKKVYYVPYKIENGDTVLMVYLDEVSIMKHRKFKSKYAEKRYWKLVRNLKKVYPYAKLAKVKLKEMNEKYLTLDKKKDRKNYAKQVEKDIRDQFEDDLKNLTITQGRLLIKLIDRETGNTSYELVKEFRGNLSAIFWQTLARLFGSNLKAHYDAQGDDRLIEDILLAIDAGYL